MSLIPGRPPCRFGELLKCDSLNVKPWVPGRLDPVSLAHLAGWMTNWGMLGIDVCTIYHTKDRRRSTKGSENTTPDTRMKNYELIYKQHYINNPKQGIWLGCHSTAMYRNDGQKKAKERTAQHMARGATIGATSCTDAHAWYVSWVFIGFPWGKNW